ncbi:shikimate dehydrogenase [Microaerobacter geothermalis]|uniref:shikimate dehydrogenase n=1 Tax=Microaerobacter geothermalis TaxID=674972 RepID=UPI001F3E079D|nr:shikimate dehydrogenase [Microaerobacter geothermalis]MCF6092906.1 shikimate dehydrogenase [Microaerobacter geothermalis]
MDSHTIMTGVLGFPVRHSLSPQMHNKAFQSLQLNFRYGSFSVEPSKLSDAVRGIRGLGFRGVNVTIPHKVAILPYLDEIDQEASLIGAVNTVVNENGRLIGYNTDGRGYVQSLKEETGIEITGKKILILGAGGAARAISVSLALEGAEQLWIANRTPEKGKQLAQSLQSLSKADDISWAEIPSVIQQVAVVVNTTSVGMFPNIEEIPISPDLLHSNLLVSDLIYNPMETKLLIEAEKRGASIHKGLGMFIYQGALAFQLWTGKEAPISLMRETVLQELLK